MIEKPEITETAPKKKTKATATPVLELEADPAKDAATDAPKESTKAIRSFTPGGIRHELLLTAITPLSHHDASVQDDSNRNLFNRQVVVAEDIGHDLPTITKEAASVIGVDHPVPAPLADMLQQLTFPEFLGVLVLRQFADEFNGMNGSGLFSGMERWSMLSERVMHAAHTGNMRSFWARLLSIMQTGLPSAARDHLLLPILSVPLGTQLDMLHALRTQGNTMTMLARYWHEAQKQMSEEYAAKKSKGKGGEQQLIVTDASRHEVFLSWADHQLVTGKGRTRRLEIPHVTANSLRHQMLRQPAMMHLMKALDIEPETLEPGVEAIFYNGGNIKAGATQPNNPNLLAKTIRNTFPSLDLLGGVANSFDLGESLVTVHSILVCAETRHLLPEWARSLPAAEVSAFDLIEDFTLTRQAGRTGEGQMIFGFEGLAAGAQFLVTLTLKPYTSTLARGAMMAALKEWTKSPVIGGASARGFGQMHIEDWHTEDQAGDEAALTEYNEYLQNHAEGLKNELLNGKMGCDKVVVN